MRAIFTCCLLVGGSTIARAEEPVDFTRDVRPLLNARCVSCHGGVKQAGDLSFAFRDQIFEQRDSGTAVVVPGDPQASELIRRITAEDESERMPPIDAHPEGLSAEEIETLTRWVSEGAKWVDHWSFIRPTRHTPPPVRNSGWCRQPMDRFILSRLERENLTPSPEAEPDRWLRRVSLDLTGLPPTPEERAAFLDHVSQQREAAYVAAVERLLDSPQFGERWASMWLDLVRYADSKGLGLDGRRTIWKYRDWVIDAFNRDLPFDEFTVKQLAGDLFPDPSLDDLMATAAHRLTQSNEEGGTDDEQFRVEAVIDRVNTTWQVWQGLTFGCTQCHDHPYDPFKNVEYYQFMAFFNRTVDSDLDSDAPLSQVPLDTAAYEEARQLDRQIDSLRERLWESGNALLTDQAGWTPLRQLQAKATDDTELGITPAEEGDQYYTKGTPYSTTGIVLEAPLPDRMTPMTALRFTGLPLDPEKSWTDPEWGFVLSHLKAELITPDAPPLELKFVQVVADEPRPLLDPNLSLNAESKDGFAAFTRIHYPRSAAFVLSEPVEVPAAARLRVTLTFQQSSGGSHPLVAKRGSLAVSCDERWTAWLNDPQHVEQRQTLTRLEEQRKAIPSVGLPVMAEQPAWLARPTHVFERGNYLTKTEPVTAGTPDVLPSLRCDDSPNRLHLANWFVSPENPLTARVAVNNVWAQIFGIGLVETQEDFGSSGEPPSHPELLDDLAVRFSEDMDWSIKSLLRELTLSATYRQSAVIRPDVLERDPQNRLLAHGPRRRLPAEVVRDQALAISGLLSTKMYGPPVHPPLPEGLWDPFDASDKWTTAEIGDENRYRRSIYIYIKRTIPYPMFASFDTPSREFCAVRRTISNTPLQALMTLNDATFHEAAAAFGRRMRSGGETLAERLRYGLLCATCREPSADEIGELESLYDALLESSPAAGDSTAGGIDGAREEAAMTVIADVLLNLDEILTN